MKFIVFFSTIVLATMSSNLFAQHDDIEFGYDDSANPSSFQFDSSDFTSEGLLFFESRFEPSAFDPLDFISDEPGLRTNAAEGLLVNTGDRIWLNVLDASQHSSVGQSLGFVNYFNPNDNTLTASGRIRIEDNFQPNENELILNGGSIESGVNPLFLDAGDSSGGVHDHVDVDLLDDNVLGAYGLLFQLQSDFADADGTTDGTVDLTSEPFWIIWNHGLDDDDFDGRALAAFGVSSVPEPSSACLLGLGLASLAMRRRRRLA